MFHMEHWEPYFSSLVRASHTVPSCHRAVPWPALSSVLSLFLASLMQKKTFGVWDPHLNPCALLTGWFLRKIFNFFKYVVLILCNVRWIQTYIVQAKRHSQLCSWSSSWCSCLLQLDLLSLYSLSSAIAGVAFSRFREQFVHWSPSFSHPQDLLVHCFCHTFHLCWWTRLLLSFV